jgi:hypothetical protein
MPPKTPRKGPKRPAPRGVRFEELENVKSILEEEFQDELSLLISKYSTSWDDANQTAADIENNQKAYEKLASDIAESKQNEFIKWLSLHSKEPESDSAWRAKAMRNAMFKVAKAKLAAEALKHRAPKPATPPRPPSPAPAPKPPAPAPKPATTSATTGTQTEEEPAAGEGYEYLENIEDQYRAADRLLLNGNVGATVNRLRSLFEYYYAKGMELENIMLKCADHTRKLEEAFWFGDMFDNLKEAQEAADAILRGEGGQLVRPAAEAKQRLQHIMDVMRSNVRM